jgi:phosphotransferase system enzyme I (PtsI)
MRRCEATDDPRGVEVHGIGVSPGVAIGPVFVIVDLMLHVPERTLAPEEVSAEVGRFEDALIQTRHQIREIQRNLAEWAAGGDAAILDAHLMVLDDYTLIEEVIQQVTVGRRNVEAAVRTTVDKHAAALSAIQDEYLRERASDLRDVMRRLLRNLTGKPSASDHKPGEKHIVVAHDLAPSEAASLNRDLVLGLALDMGSPTAHTAVLARAMDIPAVVALRDFGERLTTGDEVLIDGNKGVVILRPTPEQLVEYGRRAEVRKSIQRDLAGLRDKPAETKDGRRIILSANIEGREDLRTVKEHGAEGVGLLRSEYLYLRSHGAVGEQEQTAVYDEVAASLVPAPVIVRTLDIGGDKWFLSDTHPTEANPFLGCRSIRLSLLHPEHFKTQLRAILRASRHGNVKIMYPMICSVQEVIRANELLEEAKQELTRDGVAFDPKIEVGAMIEIPSAALTADAIAQHVQFFSIGTNDLIQYTLAVERGNERVAYLYEPTHPAVIGLIRQTVQAGHDRGIWVGLCGEMASDPLLTPLLIGLGLEELSMAPPAIPLVKDVVRGLCYKDAKRLADEAATCRSAEDIRMASRELLERMAPEILELV